MNNQGKSSGIYAIRCLADGKNTTYVGQAKDVKRRLRGHRASLRSNRHGNAHLQNAWNKYGENAFEFIVLENVSIDALTRREQHWLDEIKLTTPVYNISHKVRASCAGAMFSEEHRKKISISLRGHSVSARTRRAVSERWKTRPPDSPITRWLKGIASRGKKFTAEHSNKISLSESRPYPSFKNRETGEVIPAGLGLNRLCKARGLNISKMSEVMHGKRKHHRKWEVLK